MSQDDRRDLARAIERDAEAEIVIDLEEKKIICSNKIYSVEMKESARESLLTETFDPLDNLLKAKDQIQATAIKLGYS